MIAALAACLTTAPCLCQAASEKVIHAFQGQYKGGEPSSPLVQLGGGFYGTTTQSIGTVFFVQASGHYNVRYVFEGGAGLYPAGGLVALGGTLYGTTQSGGGTGCGGYGCGTVYSITPRGDYAQLYAFQGGADGAQPNGTLTVMNGVLYGSTAAGGASNAGTVFSVTPEGVESTLYAFSGSTDGAQPNTLITDGTNLYGTTRIGAGIGCALSKGCGTVFMINPQAGETTLYAFGTANSGGNPHGRLLKLGDDLYGTTIAGGKYNDGTVFSVSVMGVAKLLHSFDGSDGAAPYSGLTDLSGTLYGTTSTGGPDYGTIFSITRAGKLSTLYSFSDGPDGAVPMAELLAYHGTLYGTTYNGGGIGEHKGCGNPYCGTVFTFTP